MHVCVCYPPEALRLALRAWPALRLSPPFTTKPCCASLFLMRAGGMHQTLSCFLFSLSVFSLSLISLLHCSQPGSVKYLILFYPPACHQFQAVLLSFTVVPDHPRYQDVHQLPNVHFYSSLLVQREADEWFLPQSFTCANQPGAPSVETCWFLQAHLWIIWFNFTYHKTVIIAESIISSFSSSFL